MSFSTRNTCFVVLVTFFVNNVAPKRANRIFMNERSFDSEFIADLSFVNLDAANPMGEELAP